MAAADVCEKLELEDTVGIEPPEKGSSRIIEESMVTDNIPKGSSEDLTLLPNCPCRRSSINSLVIAPMAYCIPYDVSNA